MAGSASIVTSLARKSSSASVRSGEFAVSIQKACDGGRYQVECGLCFQHHHVELAVSRLVVVRDRDIELDFAEVHQQHPEAFALHLTAV